jgi:hypothetical protein
MQLRLLRGLAPSICKRTGIAPAVVAQPIRIKRRMVRLIRVNALFFKKEERLECRLIKYLVFSKS